MTDLFGTPAGNAYRRGDSLMSFSFTEMVNSYSSRLICYRRAKTITQEFVKKSDGLQPVTSLSISKR
jgi:hypothetical protein